MKRIVLHLTALAVLLPVTAVFSNGNLVFNFLGLLYAVWLFIFLNDSGTGRRFLRRYYHEILRLENMM